MNLSKEEMVEKLTEVLNGPEVAEQNKIIERRAKQNESDQLKVELAVLDAQDGPGFWDKVLGIIAAMVIMFLETFVMSVVNLQNFGMVFAIWGVTVVVTYILVPKKLHEMRFDKRMKEVSESQTSEKTKSDEQRFIELKNVISQKLGFLVSDYCEPFYMQEIQKYLRTGRADTLKEALNLLEETIHRLNMERSENK